MDASYSVIMRDQNIGVKQHCQNIKHRVCIRHFHISQIQSVIRSHPDPSLHPHSYSFAMSPPSGSVRLSHGVQFSEIGSHQLSSLSLSLAYPLKLFQTQQNGTRVTKIYNWNTWQKLRMSTLNQQTCKIIRIQSRSTDRDPSSFYPFVEHTLLPSLPLPHSFICNPCSATARN